MDKTKYRVEWEVNRPWLRPVKGKIDKAYCSLCNKSFNIDKCGVSQVNSHSAGDRHEKLEKEGNKQQTLSVSKAGEIKLTGGKFILTKEETKIKAETLNALHYVESNYSYNSATKQSLLYKEMFPDSQIAQSFTSSASKIAYIVKYGLAEYFREQLQFDLGGVPFTFKFDETTTSQVKKQYDAYATYWSKVHDCITSNYLGSLFVGHCYATDLVDHYNEFKDQFKLDNNLLLHLGMDGPKVNISFETKLKEEFRKENSSFLNLGTCSLHPVHTAFKTGLQELNFPYDSFFHDLSFFFHLSSARREDYKKLEDITDVTAHYVKKHGPTRWLSMKNVGVRVLEQKENLSEYFLNFLPKQKGFKRSDRYDRIIKELKRPEIEAYLAFMLFVSQDFESFLRFFQYDQPMIHMLWVKIVFLIRSLMSKFIARKQLFNEDEPKSADDILRINPLDKKVCKKESLIDVGTKAKVLFSGNLIGDEFEVKFRKECLRFYQIAVKYQKTFLDR